MLRAARASAPARAASPHAPHAARRGRAPGARASVRARATRRRPHRAAGRRPGSAGARPARAALLPAAAVGGRRAARRAALALTSEQAEARLAAIGFRDPRGRAARTSRALTSGLSRRATIQRHLMPVHHPVVRRRRRPRLRPPRVPPAQRRRSATTHWFLRMLRDSSDAAQRLTRVLSGSRYVGELLERIPESVAWLEDDDELRPRSLGRPRRRGARRSGPPRHDRRAMRRRCCGAIRRREVLRLALSAILGICTIEELGRRRSPTSPRPRSRRAACVARSCAARTTASTSRSSAWAGSAGASSASAPTPTSCTCTGPTASTRSAAQRARCASCPSCVRLTEDPRLPLDLDADLRPEGRNGADRPLARRVPRVLPRAGRSRGRRRRCCAHAASPATPSSSATSPSSPTTCATRQASSAGTPRDQAHQGARRERAPAAGRRPHAAPEARAAARSATSSGSCSWCSSSTRTAVPALRTHVDARRPGAPRSSTASSPAADAETLREAWLLASPARSAHHAAGWTDHRRASRRPLAARGRRRASWATRRGRRPRLEEDYLRSPVVHARCSSALLRRGAEADHA